MRAALFERGPSYLSECGAEQQTIGTAHLVWAVIRKLKSGQFRLYSRKKDESKGKRRNLGTFDLLQKARQHDREVQYFKRR